MKLSTNDIPKVCLLLAAISLGSHASSARNDGYYYLESFFESVFTERFYWPDRHYVSLSQAGANETLTFNKDDRIDLVAIADKNGRPLEAGKLYKVDVPAKMPVKKYWSLTIYNRDSFDFIRSNTGNTTVSSKDLRKIKKNADGSTTFYVGPNPPKGLDSNWLTTMGTKPLPTFRYYGPTDALYKRAFKMPDFTVVESELPTLGKCGVPISASVIRRKNC
jgi:hypothetical protein